MREVGVDVLLSRLSVILECEGYVWHVRKSKITKYMSES
jgi:hypothetical protein